MLIDGFRDSLNLFGRKKFLDDDETVFVPVIKVFLADDLGVASFGFLVDVKSSLVEGGAYLE